VISQARGKSKEHIQNYLPQIFNDLRFEAASRISDLAIKDSRAKVLEGLARDDRFIWEPPTFQMDANGDICKDKMRDPIIENYAKNPFTGPYVRNAV
jgi:hypothetical protein